MLSDDLPETREASPDTTTAAPPATVPGTPQFIANFRVIRLIGAGGMGAVYEAEQPTPRRTVALKVIRPGLVTPELRRRFETEVQLLGRLQHPGIAQIFQAGVTDLGGGPQPYFAMEFVSGSPLLEYAARRQLGSRERLRLLVDVCDAVQHAHQRGIIHRDLKPGNIVVAAESGQPKILDFGVARATDTDLQMTSHTQMGQLVGTLPYMSPEQLAADPNGLDTRSDVYALGVILYELLTGRLPHDVTNRSTLDVISAIRDSEPTRVSAFDRRLRGDVDTIVAKALEKEKDRRYGSPAELAADIRRYLDDQPIVARPPSAAYQLRKFARRNKAMVAGVAAAFLILVIGIVASTSQAVRATRAERLAGVRLVETDQARTLAQAREVEANAARRVADERRFEAETSFRQAEEARGRAERQREANRELLYVSDMNLAQRVWDEGNHPRLVELLRRHVPASGSADLRSFEWFHLWNAAHLHQRSFEYPFIGAIDLSSDNELIASGDAAGNVRLWSVRTGQRVLEFRNPQPVSAIAFSPDRQLLAIGSRMGTVRIVNAATGNQQGVLTAGNARVTLLTFASAGRVLVASSDVNRVTKIWDVATSRELLSHTGVAMPVPGHADAAVVLVRGPDVRIWSPSAEWPLALDDRIRNAAVSDDGTRVVTIGANSLVTLWDMTGKSLSSFRADRAIGGRGGMALSSGGRLLAAHADASYAVWDLAAAKVIATVPSRAELNSLSFSPSGKLLMLGGDMGVTVFDVGAAQTRTTLRGHAGFSRALTSSDERFLVTVGSDSVKVWDSSRLSAVEPLDTGAGHLESVAISPDGKWLAAASQALAGGSQRSEVTLWEMPSGRKLISKEIASPLVRIASADPRTLILADATGTVMVWDIENAGAAMNIKAHDQLVWAVAASPSGRRVASASGDEVKLWETSSGRPVASLDHRRARAVAFAPDGKHLATAGFDGLIRIWMLDTRRDPRILRGQNQGIRSLAYSPDGRLIASADETGHVWIWDVTSGQTRMKLRAHASRTTTVSFSPDGRRLLTGGLDGVLRLWDVGTWNEIAHFKEGTTSISTALFAPDGTAIVAASDRRAVLLWRAASRAAVVTGPPKK